MSDIVIKLRSRLGDHRISQLWMISIVGFFSIFAGSLIANRPMAFIGLLIAVLLAIVFSKSQVLGIGIVIVVGINFFGAFSVVDLPSIPVPGMGRFLISDIVLLLLACIMFLKFLTNEKVSLSSSISYPIIAIFVLAGIQLIRAIASGVDYNTIANQLRDIAYYLLFFIALISFRDENTIIKFLRILTIIAIITAAITYYQMITGGLNLGSLVIYTSEYGLYRSYNLGLFVMTSVFLFLFSLSIGSSNIKIFNNNLSTLIIIWIGGAILMMLMRNIWVSILLAAAIIIILNISQINRIVIILFLLSAFFAIWWAPIMEYFIGPQPVFNIISKRGMETYLDAMSGGGTFGLRTDLFKIRWEYMMQTNPFLGQGFKEASTSYLDPVYATGENTGAFIATRYGLSGFIVYLWLLIAVFKKSIQLFKKLPDPWHKSLVCGILAFNIHIVVTSYFSSPLVTAIGIVVLTPTWAILETLGNTNKQKTLEKY